MIASQNTSVYRIVVCGDCGQLDRGLPTHARDCEGHLGGANPSDVWEIEVVPKTLADDLYEAVRWIADNDAKPLRYRKPLPGPMIAALAAYADSTIPESNRGISHDAS